MFEQLIEELAGLARPAPEGLLPEVLGSIGLAERYVRRRSPLGDVFVAFGDQGISALGLADDRFEAETERLLGRPLVPTDRLPPSIERRLDGAIAEGRPGSLPLDLRGLSPFQASVLLKTAEIPRGEVRPYGWVAHEIGKPGAVRAVGSALARNPIPLIIPCHRVVRADGRFGDYSLGEAGNKPKLLRGEGLDVVALAELTRRGVRYVGSDTTRVFCHPTCRHARRIGIGHLVEFRSVSEAAAAGFRECLVCRPRAA